LRQGSYFPGFLEPRRTSEKALVAVIQEACVNFCKAFVMRHFQKPRAGMVISGSGPNLTFELLLAAINWFSRSRSFRSFRPFMSSSSYTPLAPVLADLHVHHAKLASSGSW